MAVASAVQRWPVAVSASVCVVLGCSCAPAALCQPPRASFRAPLALCAQHLGGSPQVLGLCLERLLRIHLRRALASPRRLRDSALVRIVRSSRPSPATLAPHVQLPAGPPLLH
eukprot:833120-Alexandrium_andersonii.AAC.1